jgi:hypothetical protein
MVLGRQSFRLLGRVTWTWPAATCSCPPKAFASCSKTKATASLATEQTEVPVPRNSWLGLFIAISTAVGCWVSAASPQTATGDVQDDFESGTLSEERWYLRQAVLELIDFDETSPRQGRRSLLIGIDETVRAAQALTDSEAASLRFSLIDPPTLDERGQPCPPAVEFAESPVQRNEIRVAEQLQPFFGDDLWYGFSIKALGDIPACGAVRWVIGQWKHTTADSPFLAQRFDNGVFHVSVQDDHCRCRVTQAPGDPDQARHRARQTVTVRQH